MCDSLRIGTVDRGREIRLTVDGRQIPAFEGESVHAALAAAGIRRLGLSRRTGRARGTFCGMGICYECRVTIDGIPDRRACMTPVRDGMTVDTGRQP